MLNFHLEQTLEYIHVQVRFNIRLEVQSSSPYENRAMFAVPQLQSHTLPLSPMPRQPPELPNPIRDSQPSNSNNPSNLTSSFDKGKVAHFATKVREKYKRIDPNSSLRTLERKGYKD